MDDKYNLLVYDRAGHAWSQKSPASVPRTADTTVYELRGLIDALKLPKPFFILGMSFGGLVAQAYASLFPNEVKGIILLDCTHPQLFEKIPQFEGMLASMGGKFGTVLVTFMTFGFGRMLNLFGAFTKNNTDPPAEANKRLPEISHREGAKAAAWASHLSSMFREARDMPQTLKWFKTSRPIDIPYFPVVVVSSGKHRPIQGLTAEEVGPLWLETQKDMATKLNKHPSLVGTNIVVDDEVDHISCVCSNQILPSIQKLVKAASMK